MFHYIDGANTIVGSSVKDEFGIDLFATFSGSLDVIADWAAEKTLKSSLAADFISLDRLIFCLDCNFKKGVKGPVRISTYYKRTGNGSTSRWIHTSFVRLNLGDVL